MLNLPHNPRQSVILLPTTLPTMNLNHREHWAESARKTKALRQAAGWLAKSKRLPTGLPHAWVGLVHRAPDRRRRDGDNLVAMLKPLADGLVDHGLVPDDDHVHMTKIMPIIIPPDSPDCPTIPTGAYALIIQWNGTENV